MKYIKLFESYIDMIQENEKTPEDIKDAFDKLLRDDYTSPSVLTSMNNDSAPSLPPSKSKGNKSYALILAVMKGSSRSAEFREELRKLGVKPYQIDKENGDNCHYYTIELPGELKN